MALERADSAKLRAEDLVSYRSHVVTPQMAATQAFVHQASGDFGQSLEELLKKRPHYWLRLFEMNRLRLPRDDSQEVAFRIDDVMLEIE